ncbi:MAG: MSMEG_0567/Sll0786 family nitrogen starvation N-acetyltransferase [Cyanobacteria bacterium P01_A01_bin.105]
MVKRSYSFELALSEADRADYFRLRKEIFCDEQGLFEQHDRDELDPVAYPIVAIAHPYDQYLSKINDKKGDTLLDPPLTKGGLGGIPRTSDTENNFAHPHDTPDRVVGVVRIYEETPRLWYGGRLGVHPDFRRVGRIGKGLIQKAVTTAHTWGCDRFLATVQQQNVRFFTRLHWQSLEEIDIVGRPHHLMEADLAFYPPTDQLRPALPGQRVA